MPRILTREMVSRVMELARHTGNPDLIRHMNELYAQQEIEDAIYSQQEEYPIETITTPYDGRFSLDEEITRALERVGDVVYLSHDTDFIPYSNLYRLTIRYRRGIPEPLKPTARDVLIECFLECVNKDTATTNLTNYYNNT